jgi:hypothetical protein
MRAAHEDAQENSALEFSRRHDTGGFLFHRGVSRETFSGEGFHPRAQIRAR